MISMCDDGGMENVGGISFTVGFCFLFNQKKRKLLYVILFHMSFNKCFTLEEMSLPPCPLSGCLRMRGTCHQREAEESRAFSVGASCRLYLVVFT